MQQRTGITYNQAIESMTKGLVKTMRFDGVLGVAVQHQLHRAGFNITIERKTTHYSNTHNFAQCDCCRRAQSVVSIAPKGAKGNKK